MRPLCLAITTFLLSSMLSVYVQASDTLTIKQEKNRFLKATVGYPSNYTAEFEGLTLFIIAPGGEFPWDITETKPVEYYAISLISPFFTIEDKQNQNDRSIEEIATSTAHALSITHNMSLVNEANNFDCGKAACMSISLHNSAKFHYQTFLKFGPNSVYTVSAVGFPENAVKIQKIVDLMSLNISPLPSGKPSK